jgi:hypothetical protein
MGRTLIFAFVFGFLIVQSSAFACDNGVCEEGKKGTRFLLYDVGYGERFNFRKSIFRRVFATLDALNKVSGLQV